MSVNTRPTLAGALIALVATTCTACLSSTSVSTQTVTPTTTSPRAAGLFPPIAAAALPETTVHIKIAGTFSMAGPLYISADEHYVWTEGMVRIDPATNQAVNLAKNTEADFVQPGSGSIWASDFNGNVVRRYDSAGTLLATIPVPGGPEGLASTPGAMWVASHHGGTLDRIDEATNKVTDRVPVATKGPSGAQAVTSGLGSVWTGATITQSVSRVDPASRSKTLTINLAGVGGDPCGGIAITPAVGWVSACFDSPQLDEFNPRTGRVMRSRDIGAKVSQIVADGNSVWFVAGGDPVPTPSGQIVVPGVLVQLDARWNVIHKYLLGPGFTSGGVVKAFGSIWVSNSSGLEVLRIPLSTQ